MAERAQTWVEAAMAGVTVAGASATDRELSGLRYTECHFSNVDFARSEMDGALIRESEFVGCDFSGASLTDAFLLGSSFRRCSFANANLSGARIQDSRLEECDLSGCNLLSAELDGSSFVAVWIDDLTELHFVEFSRATLFDYRHANEWRLRSWLRGLRERLTRR